VSGWRTGLLLINLGTPAAPDPRAVRVYLREFLSDPRVLDVPPLRRWLVLNLFILPFRPRRSAAAYAKIWTERGSPLLVHGLDLVEKLRRRLDPRLPVALGMRYGRPSIASALDELRRAGARRVVVFPLYPQSSSAATGSSIEEVFACARRLWNVPYVQVVPPFYEHPAFIDACASVARPYVARPGIERVFFSFHGLPERHMRKSDETAAHCLVRPDCCASIVEANRECYRAQCLATARLLGDRLGIGEAQRIVCFQSRLGRDPWIRPYTDELLVSEARAGRRRAVILSPAFVADCLETLEELGLRGAESWKASGGETLDLVPSLNSRDEWVEALLTIARDGTTWLDERALRAGRDSWSTA
jgi:ferrochelatase